MFRPYACGYQPRYTGSRCDTPPTVARTPASRAKPAVAKKKTRAKKTKPKKKKEKTKRAATAAKKAAATTKKKAAAGAAEAAEVEAEAKRVAGVHEVGAAKKETIQKATKKFKKKSKQQSKKTATTPSRQASLGTNLTKRTDGKRGAVVANRALRRGGAICQMDRLQAEPPSADWHAVFDRIFLGEMQFYKGLYPSRNRVY